MKKMKFCFMALFLTLTFNPEVNFATTPVSSSVEVVTTPGKEADALLIRLNEINSIDKSNLKSSEKKALRKEVRSIKQQIRAIGGGVYISVGSLILIALLLIILL